MEEQENFGTTTEGMSKIPIRQIKIGPRARTDYGDIEGLSASLARYGLIEPIVLDQDDGLVAGGRRLAAAVNLGWDEIGFVRRTDLNPVALKELELEENLRRKDMNWVEEVKAVRTLYDMRMERYGTTSARSEIREELGIGGYGVRDAATELDRSKSAISLDINLAKALEEFPDIASEGTKAAAWRRFHREKELQVRKEMARRDAARREAAGEAPASEPSAPRGKATGDPWLDGILNRGGDDPESAPRVPTATSQGPQHMKDLQPQNLRQQIRRAGFKGKGTVYLGDSRDVLKFFAEKHMRYDCIVTDPPFGLGLFKKGQSTSGTRLAEAEGGMYDDDPHKIMDMLDEVFMWAAKLLKDDGHAYVFFHMTRYEEVYTMLRKHFGTCEETPIIWSKNTPAIGDPNLSYVYSYEPCFFINRGRHMVKPQAFNVLRYDTIPPGQKIHPTQKPAALLRHLVQASCVEGETVLDPFCGSGSTLIGAAAVGCHFVGIEREEAFYRKALEHVASNISIEANERAATKEEGADAGQSPPSDTPSPS